MSESQPPPSDRRTAERHLACFPASLRRADGEERTALIRDLSVTGALLLVRTEVHIGDKLRLALHISENIDEVREATAEVLRVVPLADDELGLWLKKVAVHFDHAMTIYEKEIDELHERQARLGLTK